VSRRADRDRFDTVPDIKPDIELPRIREFLQTSDGAKAESEPTGSENGESAPLNSYDLVLRRAQAIKSASKAERQGRADQSTRRVSVPPSGPSLPVEQRDTRTKRSDRINQLPAIEWDVEPDSDDVSLTRAHLPDLDTDEVVSGRSGPLQHHDPERDVRDVEMYASPFADDAGPDDEQAEFDDDDTYMDNPPQVDHSRSWWRSLNFSRPRRKPEHVGAKNPYHAFDSADAFDSGEAGRDFDQFDDVDTFDQDELDGAARPDISFLERSGSGSRDSITSRASRQPVWEPLDEIEHSPVQHEPVTRSSREPSIPRKDARHLEQPTRNSAKGPETGFAMDDDQDMDAFRTALFGDERKTQPNSAAQVRHAHEREREVAATQRQLVGATTAREPRRSQYQALDENTREHVFTNDLMVNGWDEPSHAAEFDIRDHVASQDDLLDMTIALAPDLPRVCQTCRDFRPSESGERGWCTNDWAFTHRQMVNADSLPCQSSIGCWWLPNDASWLPAFDPAERQAPTPWTDRLAARSRPDEMLTDQKHQRLYVREI